MRRGSMYATQSLLLLCFLHAGTCFITRLPECMYVGNFTIRLQNVYFTSPVTLILEDVSRDECTLYCTMNDECLFVNYETHGSRCELLNSHVGNHTHKPGWLFVSPNYDDWQYRGKNCFYIRPKCGDMEFCADTCEHPGYKCQALRNLALSAKKIGPRTVSSNTPPLAANGNPYDCYDTGIAASRPPNWWGVDLGKTKKILFVHLDLHNGVSYFTNMKILIGDRDESSMDENAICFAGSQDSSRKRYSCFLLGRYVFIKKTTSQSFAICEVHVSSL